jgi:outer membrane protein assembly factor BamB/predicted phosphodiesterase
MRKFLLTILLILVSTLLWGQEFHFAVVTDIHLSPTNPSAEEDLRNTVKEINTNPGIKFVLVTGDLTDLGDRGSLQTAKDILDELNVKYYPISGNHETKWSESGATAFGDIFGSERFDFEYNRVKFLGFNTGPVIRMMDGHVAPQDINWLKEELARLPKNQPVVLVTHYPLLPVDVDNWYEVTDAVRNYNVRAFIGGHYHSNRLFNYDGIPAFICRSNLRAKEPVGGYSIFEVTPDSIIVNEKKIGQEPHKWGSYSMKEIYYTADNSSYSRPDFSVNNEYNKVKEVWRISNPNAIYTSPVVYNDKVYLGDDTGIFSCYSVKDGKRVWSLTSGNRIVGTAAAANGIVVFGSADKNIYALNAETGGFIWRFATREPVLGSVAIDNGKVYVGDSDHTFRCLDLNTGDLIWEYTGVKGYIETRPLIYDNKVIFGAWDNNMYALDKNTGASVWTWADGRPGMMFSPAAVWPVAAHGKVFFTAPDRVMSAVNAKTGETVWRTNQSMVRETIGLSEDKERVYSKTMQDSVVCYSAKPDKPQRLWATNVAYGYDHAPSMPVEKDGVVYGSTKNGIIFALEGKTGKLLWKHKVGNSIINTVWPLSGKECIYSSGEGIIGRLRYEE